MVRWTIKGRERLTEALRKLHRSSVVVGVYVIIFGLGVALLEFQIPPQVSRYASFLFSFLGRGICKLPLPFSYPRLELRKKLSFVSYLIMG